MERQTLFNVIEEKLSFLLTRIELRGKLNVLDLNTHIESFFCQLLGLVYGWKLVNLNRSSQNAAAVDLKDVDSKVVVQVTSNKSKQKIQETLDKVKTAHKNHKLIMLLVSSCAKNLRSKVYTIEGVDFDPFTDIIDFTLLLKEIHSLPLEKQALIADLLSQEIKYHHDLEKTETNLTKIIRNFAKVDWSSKDEVSKPLPFKIEDKIHHNKLQLSKGLISEFKIHYNRINKIYSSFNEFGINKTLSVLNGIRSVYLELAKSSKEDELFIAVIKRLIDKLEPERLSLKIPEEEVELCVQLLVVDCFIRCKIFECPEGYEYVDS